jgi:hypothetical protein
MPKNYKNNKKLDYTSNDILIVDLILSFLILLLLIIPFPNTKVFKIIRVSMLLILFVSSVIENIILSKRIKGMLKNEKE